jgi:hypothetical protein
MIIPTASFAGSPSVPKRGISRPALISREGRKVSISPVSILDAIKVENSFATSLTSKLLLSKTKSLFVKKANNTASSQLAALHGATLPGNNLIKIEYEIRFTAVVHKPKKR